MASSPPARALTEQHRQAQVQLAAVTAVQTRRLWALLDIERLAETADGWAEAMLLLMARQHGISVSVARTYFRRFRTLEAGAPPPATLPAPQLNGQAARTSMMATGPGQVLNGLSRGRDPTTAARFALGHVAGAASRQVLTGGRDMLRTAVVSDRMAQGWARVTSGSPCAFCALLAGRGPVYSEDGGAFQAHDSCACTVEPVYSRDAAWPPGARDYADLYDQKASGTSDPLNSFRRAYEGRDG